MKKHGKWSVKTSIIAVLCLFTAISATVMVFRAITANAEQAQSVTGVGFGTKGPPAEMPIHPAASESKPESGGSPISSDSLSSGSSASQLPVLQCRYFNEQDFMNSVLAVRRSRPTLDHSNTSPNPSDAAPDHTDTAPNQGSTVKNPIAGGIVPHHLLAGNMIAEFFHAISQSSPETVIVVGPNHRRVGLSSIHTSTQSWGTSFGVLDADVELAEKLISDLNASQNAALFEEEHSISSLVPYIKYYLPKAKIVPVLLHGNYTEENSRKLGKLLASALPARSNSVIIASVDFSHYLDVNTANKMDEITLKAIKSNDIQSISRMGNDNLDSPASIITLLSAMKEKDTTSIEVTGHGNSSDITRSGADYTTSYYTMVFRRDSP